MLSTTVAVQDVFDQSRPVHKGRTKGPSSVTLADARGDRHLATPFAAGPGATHLCAAHRPAPGYEVAD
jgi:hypothetical protein